MSKSREQWEFEYVELEAHSEGLELENVQLRDLLLRCSTMLEESLCPRIDHPEAFAWIEERRALLEEVRSTLDGYTHDTEEVC